LPVVEQVIDPEEVTALPEQWRCIGEEVSEQLDYEPARFLKRRLVRRKYVSRQEVWAQPIIAPLPSVLQERGSAAPGLLAQIIVSKFVDHLPLYRQEQIYRTRYGISLSRPTMVRWVELVADWLKPIYQCIRTGVMAGGYVQVDETPVRYLDPGNGKTKTGYFWTTSRPGGDVVYQWETSRAAVCLDKVSPVDFEGTVQCDGYAGYASFARRKKHIQLAACWDTREGSFTRRGNKTRRSQAGSCARSVIFTGSSERCAKVEAGLDCGPLRAGIRLSPFTTG
jgi:transposase